MNIRHRRAVLVAAAVVAGMTVAVTSTQPVQGSSALVLPAEVEYELLYQEDVNPATPLNEARVRWTVSSLSDWRFEFLTGPDAGLVTRLHPDGRFVTSYGDFESTYRFKPGHELVPLPDFAFDSYVAATVSVDAPLAPGVFVDRTSPEVVNAISLVSSRIGLDNQYLRGASFSRRSETDLARFDEAVGDWVGQPAFVIETIVVDINTGVVLFRTLEADGLLLRSLEVISIGDAPPG